MAQNKSSVRQQKRDNLPLFLLVLQKQPAAEPIAATELRPGRSAKHHKNS